MMLVGEPQEFVNYMSFLLSDGWRHAIVSSSIDILFFIPSDERALDCDEIW